MARTYSAGVVLAAVALVAAGCGGSSTLSKDELAKKADAICREGRVAFARKLGPNPNFPSDTVVYDAGVLRVYAPLEKRLRDLDPPESESKTWKAYLAARRVSTALVQREERAARSGDQKEMQSIAAAQKAASQKRSQIARKLGLKICGNPKDVPNLLGPPQPVGPPPSSVGYVKPKNTLDDAISTLTKIKTCGQLQAFQNSDDTKVPEAACKSLIPALAGLHVLAKDDLGPVGVIDFRSNVGNGTALFSEDAKDGMLKLSTFFPNEGGAVHKPPPVNDAAKNIEAAVVALRAGDGAAFHRVLSENSDVYSKPPASIVGTLGSTTGSGKKLVADLKADRAAKPQTLGIDSTFGFFALDANGHHYVLIAQKGPTGYKYIAFYPQPAG